ncbi:MAG TPA: hypothetical protein VJR27_03415 [Candidatus Saccharimonadales bacterium]|nr:hypothetical protein [Candidatus Saccharimonadales bacterium]
MNKKSFQPDQDRAVLLGYSNLNLPKRMVAATGIAGLRKYLAEVEADRSTSERIFPGAYEITPTRRLILDSLFGRLQPGDASSVHQTWPSGPIKG